MARPSSYTEEIAEKLCERLSTCEGGLEQVCAAHDMPSTGAVYRWLHDPERVEFRKAYARAREQLGDYMAFKAVSESITTTDHQIGRLRMDARKWAAARLNGRWSEKVTVVGGDPEAGDKPVQHEMTLRFVKAGE